MKNARMALCLAGGYLLGRFHKMRWALGLAGVAAGRRLRASGGGALGELLKAPALDQLQHLRGELLAAGRTAAVAMAGNRIDALSDRLQERAASLRTEPSGERPEAESEEAEGDGEREARGEERGSGGGGRGAAERDTEISRRRAERLRARSSGGARRTTQTSRGTRRTAASERSGGRSGREGSTAGESSRRSRG